MARLTDGLLIYSGFSRADQDLTEEVNEDHPHVGRSTSKEWLQTGLNSLRMDDSGRKWRRPMAIYQIYTLSISY